jgi:hypothetical protein
VQMYRPQINKMVSLVPAFATQSATTFRHTQIRNVLDENISRFVSHRPIVFYKYISSFITIVYKHIFLDFHHVLVVLVVKDPRERNVFQINNML